MAGADRYVELDGPNDAQNRARAAHWLTGLREEFNKLVADVELVRGTNASTFLVTHEDLGAGADIVDRAIFASIGAITTIVFARYIPQANSVGVDGANTLTIAIRNITQGTDLATVTLTANVTVNVPVTVTATGNLIAANDIIGYSITQGATANVGTGVVMLVVRNAATDTADDLLASQLKTQL